MGCSEFGSFLKVYFLLVIWSWIEAAQGRQIWCLQWQTQGMQKLPQTQLKPRTWPGTAVWGRLVVSHLFLWHVGIFYWTRAGLLVELCFICINGAPATTWGLWKLREDLDRCWLFLQKNLKQSWCLEVPQQSPGLHGAPPLLQVCVYRHANAHRYLVCVYAVWLYINMYIYYIEYPSSDSMVLQVLSL